MRKLWNKITAVLLCAGMVFAADGLQACGQVNGGEGFLQETAGAETRMQEEGADGGAAQEEIAEPENLYALSACLMDADSGRVLYEKEGEVHRANASTTKIMTLILTLERADLDETVTVSGRAARQPDVQLNINTGEEYRLGDLCYSLMLESHNDSAVAIAEHVGGSVEEFAALMNEKAQELGCAQTYFITPNGLDEQDGTNFHGTSAVDLARIMSYCIMRSPKSGEFLEITRTPSYTFTDLSGKRSFTCNNHNAFLNMMEGALSGKTGFTGDAGYCYVGALERDDRTFVVALLGCGWPNNKTYKWKDCRTLFTYGLENYAYQTLAQPLGSWEYALIGGKSESGDPYELPVVSLAEENHEPLRLLLRSDEQLVSEERLDLTERAPVAAGQESGSVSYYLQKDDGERELVYRAGIYAVNGVEEKDLAFYVRFLFRRFLVL
ncbi:D-alanyl-D-alanine carboxypeptidase family protein [Lachnospiraceae bacterium 47-T17]